MKCKKNIIKIKLLSIIIALLVILNTTVAIKAKDDIESNWIETDEQNLAAITLPSGYHGYVLLATDSTYLGISANIGLPYVLPNVQGSAESVWVSTTVIEGDRWIQAGARYREGYTAFNKYVEYYENGSMKRKEEFGTQSLNTSILYEVEFNTNDGKWHAYIEGQDCASSSFSAFQHIVEAGGEIHKEGIQLGPFRFTNVKLKNPSAIWIDNNTMPNYCMPGYSFSGIETMFSIWGPD